VRKLGIALLFAALVAGCTPGSRWASVNYVFPRGEPERVEVSLSAPGNWRAGGHNVFPYRELHSYTLVLPKWPKGRVRFYSSELTLRNLTFEDDATVMLSGGYVEIDLDDEEVILALQTPFGKFWANGRYPTN
jgi:hypothetical protein